MGFTGLAAALFLLLYFVKMEFEKNGMKWGNYLDYALLVSLVILILGFVFDIWRTFKDRRESQKEHDGIKENDNKNKDLLDKNKDLLVKDHERLSSEHGELKTGQTNISQTAAEIRTTVYAMSSQLTEERVRREIMMESMSTGQRDLYSQINAISALNQQLPALQLEKQQLSEKYGDLQQRYDELKAQHQILQQKYHALLNPPELSESEEFTQTME